MQIVDPSQDPERRVALTRALHSLKEDATFAWKQSLSGDVSTIPIVIRAAIHVGQIAKTLAPGTSPTGEDEADPPE